MDFKIIKEYPVHIAVIIAFIAGIFSYATFKCPLSVWIWPAALLFAVRSVNVKKGALISIAVIVTSSLIAYIIPIIVSVSTTIELLLMIVIQVFISGIMSTIPFVVDRLFYGKIGTVRQLFIFPLTLATVSFFTWMLPAGSSTSFIYTQTEFHCFAQGLSIYGILGMIFLLGWFATSVNLFIKALPTRAKEIRWTAVCAIVIAAVIIFGGVRLATAEEPKTVNVLFAEGPLCCQTDDLTLEGQIEVFDQVINTAFNEKAKMIVFYEDSFLLKDGEISSFEEHAAKCVKASGIYLLYTSEIEKDGIKHNICTFVTPENGIEWRYSKTNLVFMMETGITAGDGTTYFTDTPFGRVTAVICHDLYFHHFINSIDKDADILIAPSFDWRGFEEWNTRGHSFRTIENGVSLIKPTAYGTSSTYDQYGRLVDTYTSFEHTPGSTHMVKASTGGCYTFYGEYGQIIDWMFVICTIMLLLSCMYTCRHSHENVQDEL